MSFKRAVFSCMCVILTHNMENLFYSIIFNIGVNLPVIKMKGKHLGHLKRYFLYFNNFKQITNIIKTFLGA